MRISQTKIFVKNEAFCTSSGVGDTPTVKIEFMVIPYSDAIDALPFNKSFTKASLEANPEKVVAPASYKKKRTVRKILEKKCVPLAH